MKKPISVHNIVLLVDTENLKDIPVNSPNLDLNDYCAFMGQDPGVNLDLFTTQAANGDTVIWHGMSTSSDSAEVLITDISRESGSNFLENPGGPGSASGNKGIGKRVSKIKNAKKNKWEKYNLVFKIKDGQDETGQYTIDPIINVYA